MCLIVTLGTSALVLAKQPDLEAWQPARVRVGGCHQLSSSSLHSHSRLPRSPRPSLPSIMSSSAIHPSHSTDSGATLATASTSAQTMSTAASSQRPHGGFQSPLNPLDRVIDTGSGRILCIADIRGDFRKLNQLVEEHDAVAVIHTGDFGFLDGKSPSRMASR